MRKSNDTEKKMTGKESDWSNMDSKKLSKDVLFNILNKAFRFYNYHEYPVKKQIAEYQKIHSLNYHISNVPDVFLSPIAWLCRMINHCGLIPNNEINDKILSTLKKYHGYEPKDSEKIEYKKPKKENKILGKFEFEIDKFIENDCSGFDFKEFVETNEIKSRTIFQEIKSIAKKFMDELIESFDKNSQLNEGYSFISDKNKKKLIDLLNSIILFKTYRKKNTKQKRIENKKKKIIIEEKNDSINGKKELWVFNKKYKSLTRYIAEEGKTLFLDRKTIKNFDMNKSIKKSIKKKNIYKLKWLSGIKDPSNLNILFEKFENVIMKIGSRFDYTKDEYEIMISI